MTTTVTIAGLNVLRKMYVPNAGTLGFLRYLEVLQNPTVAPITVKVRIGSVDGSYSDLGSDSSTMVTATSDGMGVLGPGLHWFTTELPLVDRCVTWLHTLARGPLTT